MAALNLTSGTFQQTSFDKVGDGFKYDSIKLASGSYIAARPYQLNSGTLITGPEDGSAVITLAPGVPGTLFPSMTPVLGQVTQKVENITIENVTFDGNYLKQVVPHGKGFHNFVGLSNCSNLDVHNVTVKNSMGDGVRIVDSSGVKFSRNKINGCGHDGLYTDRCSGVEAWNNKIYVRINSGLRCKGSKNVSFHHNDIQRISTYSPATGPLIQVENSRANETASNVSIYENYLASAQGPGIWAAAHSASSLDAATGLTIKNNLIVNCGQMPTSIEAAGLVSGVSVDGWNNVLIENNTIDGCLGGGIWFRPYMSTSANSGYKGIVRRNIITNTKKNPLGSGGIALLNSGKYDLEISENCFYGNHSNGLTGSNPVLANPLFVNGYHLSSIGGHYTASGYVLDSVNSPCLYADGEAGRYNGTQEASRYCIIDEPVIIEEPHTDPVTSPEGYEIVLSCSSEEDALKGLEWLKSATIRRV